METFDPTSLVSYGLGGILVILFLTKQMVPGWIYRNLQKENENLNAQVKRLQDVHEEKVLPALYKYNEVLDKLVHTEVRLPDRQGGG